MSWIKPFGKIANLAKTMFKIKIRKVKVHNKLKLFHVIIRTTIEVNNDSSKSKMPSNKKISRQSVSAQHASSHLHIVFLLNDGRCVISCV